MGSVDEARQFDPPVTDPVAARGACEELGGALAEAGWNLVVYSGRPSYVEADVVRGYLRSGKALPRSIEVRAPLGKSGFGDEFSASGDIFDIHPDPSRDWEVSFYRSLAQVDGVLLVGGGRSTLITGLIALTLRIPLVTVATFGGNALKVWERLANEPNDATADDVSAMAAAIWQPDAAARRMVRSMSAQRDAREQRRQGEERQVRREIRSTRIGLAVLAVLLLIVIAVLAVPWGLQLGTGLGIAVLMLLPTLAGAAGGLAKTAYDKAQEWARGAVLGGAAGLITGGLYIVAQIIGAPDVLTAAQPDSVRRLLFFVLAIGFVAGFTFDAVYTKLRGKDVSQAATLDAITANPQQGQR